MTSLDAPAVVLTGTSTYYQDRQADFIRRFPDLEPPDYYLHFGDKCLHQFLRVEPHLTPDGQQWLRRTLLALQDKMEGERQRDPKRYGDLERDGAAFHDFAFSTHSAAYLEAGLLTLPVDDLWKIVRTPDLFDLLTVDGVKAIADVLEEMSLHDLATIARKTFADRPEHPAAGRA